MTRVLKILIGTTHASEDRIKADICGILAGVLANQIHVFKEHTLVVFPTEDALLEFLKNVTGSMAGVDDVKFEELTPNDALVAIRGVEGLEYLEDILNGQAARSDLNTNPAANSDPAEQNGNENVRYNDQHAMGTLSDEGANSDPAENINPAADSDPVFEMVFYVDDDEKYEC